MVLVWNRNSVLTLVFLPRQTTKMRINFFGGVVQEKESKMGFYRRWTFSALGMTVLMGTLCWKRPYTTEPHIRFLYSMS